MEEQGSSHMRHLLHITGTLIMAATVAGCMVPEAYRTPDLGVTLLQTQNRIQEERSVPPSQPNAPTYRRAVGADVPPPGPSSPAAKEQKLTIDDCLRLAFANNNQLKQAREQLSVVGGDELITNARFLPTVEAVSQYEALHGQGHEAVSQHAYLAGVQYKQRLLEFGKDNPADVALRAEQRQALLNHETTSTSVLSQVRRDFYHVVLQRDQIAARRTFLSEFQKQYDLKRERLEAGGLSVRMELLTARLDVLNEETQVNALVREQASTKADLLRLIGLPPTGQDVIYEGDLDAFALDGLDLNWAVNVALERGTQIAFLRSETADQERQVAELRTEYLPDLQFSVGYQDENASVSVNLSNDQDTWGLDVLAQPQLSEHTLTLLNGAAVTLPGPSPGAFAGIQLSVPIFEGGARRGRQVKARAQLASLKAALADAGDSVAAGVRQAYERLREQAQFVALDKEQVAIAQDRLNIQQQLKAVGKITDNELETFRLQFFQAQDALFQDQSVLIDRQEDLRLAMRYFK